MLLAEKLGVGAAISLEHQKVLRLGVREPVGQGPELLAFDRRVANRFEFDRAAVGRRGRRLVVSIAGP